MRKQSAQQTIFALLAWLFLQNFNVTTAIGRSAAALEVSDHAGIPPAGGKSTESLCTANPPFHILSGIIAQPSYHIRKVVLDAGHGGKDPGCIGAISREKHNALAIVLKLGALINAAFPDVEVIYTRDSDVFIELKERAAIANRNNADLFISVHCNSISVSHVKGAETYVMGLHTAEHNLEVAKRENASILLEDNYQKNYAGYDPNSPEAHILGSVWQSAYLEQSILFASLVQKHAKSIGKREDKGVKQAGFLVLRETAMPSVLVEAGYLTNRTEESFIASEEGQALMAESIFEAFRAYKAQLEGTPLAASPPPAAVPAPKPAQATAVAASQKTPAEPKTSTANPPAKTQPTANPALANTGDVYADEVIPVSTPAKPGKAANFRIHLMNWPSRLDKNTGQLSLIGDISEEQSGGQYHYFTGKFATRSEAEKMLAEVFNLGFRTASIVQLNIPNN